jgi:hypothetical protein
MNDKILPALRLTPRELLWGERNEKRKQEETLEETSNTDAEHHFSLSDITRAEGYSCMITEAEQRKSRHDSGVTPAEFETGDLVQVYDSQRDGNYDTRNKLLPRWSPPRIIIGRDLNSYYLEKLDRTEIGTAIHAKRLRRYIPRIGSEVDQAYGQTMAKEPDELEEEITEAEKAMEDNIDTLLEGTREEDAQGRASPGGGNLEQGEWASGEERQGCGSMRVQEDEEGHRCRTEPEYIACIQAESESIA